MTSPTTDQANRIEEQKRMHKHPEAPDGQSEPSKMLGLVLTWTIIFGLCIALALPFIFMIGRR